MEAILSVRFFKLHMFYFRKRVVQVISGATYNASALSIVYQIPQYCLIGAAEVFAGVAGTLFNNDAIIFLKCYFSCALNMIKL